MRSKTLSQRATLGYQLVYIIIAVFCHAKWYLAAKNWGVSIRHSAMEQFTDLSFQYVKSVSKIYFLYNQNEDIAVSLWHLYLIISSFNMYFWRFWPFLEFWDLFSILVPKLPHDVRYNPIIYPFLYFMVRELWRHIRKL